MGATFPTCPTSILWSEEGPSNSAVGMCIRLGPQGRHQCEIKHAKILLEKMLYEDKIKEEAMAV